MRRRGRVPVDYLPENVEEFYEPPVGHWRFGAFPPDRFVVGMAFEVGGTHEDWGWIMYEKTYVPESRPAAWTLTSFVQARTLTELIQKADWKMREASRKMRETSRR